VLVTEKDVAQGRPRVLVPQAPRSPPQERAVLTTGADPLSASAVRGRIRCARNVVTDRRVAAYE
jgi:hypothetical protein